MKFSFSTVIGRRLSLLTVAGIILFSSCKKSQVENPSDTNDSTNEPETEAINIYQKCLPTTIKLTPPDMSAWDLQETFNREEMLNIKYDLKGRPMSADNDYGNRHFTFTYDGNNNLTRLKMYDDNLKVYLQQWLFEYEPGATNSYSPSVKTTYFIWNSQTGSKEYKTIRYYDNNKRIVRQQINATQSGPNTRFYFFNYDAAGNLTTVTEGTNPATAIVMYQFKQYDNNPTAVSSHYVWQLLSGNYSKNNLGGTIRLPQQAAETANNCTYQYGAYGYPVKAVVTQPGFNSSFTTRVATFNCPVVTPIPAPQPIPIPFPKPGTVTF